MSLSIETFSEILDEVITEVPPDILEGLNLGIVIEEQILFHEEAVNEDLVVLGQYKRSGLGKGVVLYYGSFIRMYPNADEQQMKERARSVLFHELRHHLEHKANNIDLEIEDALFIHEHKKKRDAGSL